MQKKPDIGALLNPKTVAVIGAAPSGQGIRGRILEVLRSHAFKGKIFPVSRNLAEVQGLKAYPNIGACPEPVDLAIFVIPAKFVAQELEACGKAGVKAAIIISSGFAEEPGETGAQMQAEIKAIAARYNMAVNGPNSEGFASLEEVASLGTEEASAAAVPPPLEGHVAFRHVSFRYPGAVDDVLSDVTLEVLPGQTVAVVGRSGSGKTTLVNLLMGLYPPTTGNVYIDHLDIQSIPSAALRRQLGVVEQHPFLFDGTIRDNIAKADPSAPIERIIAAATIAGAHALVEALPSGYDTPVGERGAALSGGEKQRLMIARALVTMPRLLILDEATSAVDSASERLIQQNIRQATAGRTTFIIAHRLSTIRHADVIVVLDRGRVVETGTHASLMAARRLYYYLNTRTV